MSLQLAAQHLASRGRGPDTTLVHMAPQEVAGLQALAMRHGGSLTTNPDTGLAEAGFLSSILPMVAGAFLGPAGFGLTAMQAGLAAGALGTVATGSLKKGLMAGFGAYGGAGLAGSLMGAGAGAAQNAAMAAVDPAVGFTSGMGEVAAIEGAGVAGTNIPTMGSSALGSATQAGMQPLAGVPGKFVSSAVPAGPASSMVAPQNVVQSIAEQVPTSTTMPDLTRQGFLNEAAARVTPGTELYKAAGTSTFDTAKAGLGEVMKRPGDFLTKDNLKYGLMGLAPVAMDMLTPKQREIAEKEKLKPTNFNFAYNQRANPNAGYTGAQTGERMHFDPIYTPISAAGGGLMDIGPIEAMSDRNQAETMMANGGMRFAEGGKAVSKVEDDPYYTMSGQSGDAYKYLMGQGPRPAATTTPAPAIIAPVQSTVQAAPVQERRGLLGRVMGVVNPAAGYSEDGTNGLIKPYSFDPNTGLFTAVPVQRSVTQYAPEPAPVMDYGSFTGGSFADGGIASLAQGGASHLGDYSDGGRLLKGPGDGVSDSIPASIGDKRPARLADGEFVVPARIVSELGNGSTEAGARKLYAMMDRVQKARKKSIGKDRVAVNSRAEKMLPA
jgi:hypothetical protein